MFTHLCEEYPHLDAWVHGRPEATVDLDLVVETTEVLFWLLTFLQAARLLFF